MSITSIGNGRWRVRTKTGIDPKTGKTLYFDKVIKGTHEDAKRLEAEHVLFDKALFAKLTIQSYAEAKWLPAIKQELSGNTFDYYEGTLKRWVLPFIGHINLRDFDVPTCKAYFLELPETRRTVARKTLSSLLSFAAEDGAIPHNPVKLLSRKTKTSKAERRRKKAHRTFSADERIRFYKAIEGTIIEALCLVMLDGGARREEACALDWEMFDWDDSRVAIERAYVVRSGSGTCEMKEPKNEESYRDLYFAGYAEDRLYELSIGQSGAICKDADGNRMRPDRANELFKAICELYGLPKDMTIKNLRHTFATQHIKDGTDIATLRDLMGHSSISTITNEYLLPLEDDKRLAQQRLANSHDPRKVKTI